MLCSFAYSAAALSLFRPFVPHRLSRGFRTALQATAGPTLYGSNGSRSPLVNWGAYELNIPLQMGNLSHNPHPFGQIPTLTDDDDVLVFESGAILQYLYSHSATRLQDSQARQASILSWIVWANASLDPICFLANDGRVYDTGLRKPNRRIDTLNDLLSKQEFLVQDGFSMADVAVASYLLYVLQFFPDVDLTRWPSLVKYMRLCASRQAYGKAFGNRVQSYLISALDAMMVVDDDKEDGEDSNRKIFGIF
jgi:glutathione S-transferase/alpha,alpha-trehalase